MELTGVTVTEGYFRTVGLEAHLGRLFTGEDATPGQPSVIAAISHRLWVERFGADQGVLGRTIVVDGVPREIVGVLPPRYVALGPTADLILPYELSMPTRPNYGIRFIDAVGRLAPGVSVARADEGVRRVYERIASEYPVMAQSWTANAVRFCSAVFATVRIHPMCITTTAGPAPGTASTAGAPIHCQPSKSAAVRAIRFWKTGTVA